jgi:hypothetical protein
MNHTEVNPSTMIQSAVIGVVYIDGNYIGEDYLVKGNLQDHKW